MRTVFMGPGTQYMAQPKSFHGSVPKRWVSA